MHNWSNFFYIFKDFFEKHSDINLTALSNCKTLDEFVSLLKGSIYYRPLSLLSGLSEPTLWDYEMALDLCYFKWFWDSRKKVLTRDEERIFMDDYGVRLQTSQIKEMVEAATTDELTAAIRNTYYGRHFPEEAKLSLDDAYYQIRYRVQRKNAKEDPFSIAVIISYLYEKEHEVDDLTTTLECIRYGLPTSETQKYISNLKRGCNR